MRVVDYKGKRYPGFQVGGNAARFAIPYALEVCQGTGYDIGCCREEWKLPGAIGIDLAWDDPWDALNLPGKDVDFIFSSHCLEHVEDWVTVLDYWTETLRPGGTLFLYLPHYDQEYWRPWNNRKHRHIFTPQIMRDYLEDRGYDPVFVGERDLYHGFMAIAARGARPSP